MDYIYFALSFLFVLFIYIVITKICMWAANSVGEQLGVGKSLMYLWRKIRKI